MSTGDTSPHRLFDRSEHQETGNHALQEGVATPETIISRLLTLYLKMLPYLRPGILRTRTWYSCCPLLQHLRSSHCMGPMLDQVDHLKQLEILRDQATVILHFLPKLNDSL